MDEQDVIIDRKVSSNVIEALPDDLMAIPGGTAPLTVYSENTSMDPALKALSSAIKYEGMSESEISSMQNANHLVKLKHYKRRKNNKKHKRYGKRNDFND